ncbi:MAG: CPBP family intramembrane metalloprotease [Rudaea sp.]|uniref:CPBP family intramembrane glutamic endopeptidase n=1 Tax=unclassified Rudaea TaxID=2627037 RepID=UPI0010F6D8E8|nr:MULTISPECIES: type II CAAX endopeptidase family protein [unclassified Rudaea]MBN8885858.1 CPBP family intramembrane metalloprotease [Rudaea sp.]MBR0347263.1 CPBP family intramembrane metalloprotease [Rudaea sp.]
MHWLRHPAARLVVEIAILAIPLNLAYRFAMQIVYRLDALWGTLFALIAAVVACNAYNLCARFFAKRSADELAPRRARGALYGAGLGALLIGLVVAALALTGTAKVGEGGAFALAGLPGVAILAAAFEELVARGVVLRNLENVFGSAVALVLSAALFAVLHIGNPNWTPLSIAAIGVEGGLMLGAVYVATRSLWWVFGVHAAWNFTQTGLFGIADSGHPGRGLLHTELSGPAWLTGGAFGIEASALSVALCAIVAAGFLIHAWRRGRFVAPFWKPSHSI